MEGSSPESDPKFQKKLGEYLGKDLDQLKKIAQETVGPTIDSIDKTIQKYLGAYYEEMSGKARGELIATHKGYHQRQADMRGKERTDEYDQEGSKMRTRIYELEDFIDICNRYAGFQWNETRKKVDNVLGIKKNHPVDDAVLSRLIPRETYFSQFIRFTEDEKREYRELMDKHPDPDDEGYRAAQMNQIRKYDVAQKIFREFFPPRQTPQNSIYT